MRFLPLLLAATAATATTASTATVAAHSSCAQLANKTANQAALAGWRSVAYHGRAVNVTLVWGSEPAHAAAALLAVLLRHVRLYLGVQLPRARSPHDIAALATNVSYDIHASYDNLVVGISTAWRPGPPAPWGEFRGAEPGLAGPRLAEFGASPVPTRRRLFATLSGAARQRDYCRQLHVRWASYANATLLAGCDFFDAQNNTVLVYVLGDDKCDALQQRLQLRAEHSGARLHLQRLSRAGFERSLQPQHSANRSFLFLDYDMWHKVPGVSIVEPPPCESVDIHCTQELDTAIAMRVADVDILQSYAPQFLQFIRDFKPSLKSLRSILERQANGVDIEEAACEMALDERTYGRNKTLDLHKYTVLIYFCSGDPSNRFYSQHIGYQISRFIYYQTSKYGCDLQMFREFVNCSDDYHMSEKLNDYIKSSSFNALLGVVSMTGEGKGATAAAAIASASRVPLILADVVPEDGVAAARSTWRVGPTPRHLARALLHFVRESHWTRVAVLSQPTNLARDYYAALEEWADAANKIVLRDFPVPLHNLRKQHAQKVLQELQEVNARIVFINADARAASVILDAAVAAGMGYADGYVWIVRDWQHNNVVCRTEHFIVSSWSRGVEDISRGEGTAALRNKMKDLPRPWPPHAVSFANALLTLSVGFLDIFKGLTMRQDLHRNEMIRSLQESLISKPVTGVSQQLRFKERSIEETFVFVDQWRGGNFTRLARWRVNATSGAVRGQSTGRAALSPPLGLPLYDGASGCIVRSGDKFYPRCHDIPCIFALLLLALAPAVALLARRALRRRFARLQQEQQIQAIARRRHVATVLAAYLVERTALELHEELGAGRFGSVRLARLRVDARAPRYIAAKALRENAAPTEESEFLREACTIASLEHAHIVRLVGVCIADGPPLVLMELAFFGDLLGYLRARRHLVEGAVSESLEAPTACGEAEHVSAAALTRLAREAAEALQYLAVRGVVHRDVRAANCLVDERRSLKLADFGMARDTVASADGAPEYACRRRGLFPVLWMAPESLAQGVFSAASDVWALGVLVLELVTLGTRPYGSMSPLRVLEYVAAGGSPPLPLDATPQTRGLARLCWAHAVARRPSAVQVAAYLAAWPLALRPALQSECDEPADADSGFGESPSTELLPPDSPLHSLDQLDDFAVSH